MTTYEREHNGSTPAEDGERAARAEAREALKARDEKRRQDFLAQIRQPEVRRAAINAVIAMRDLERLGIRVTDWANVGPRITEVEIESTMSNEKGWIKIED